MGAPTGVDLCSGTTDADTLPYAPSTYEFREISLGAGTTLVSGTKYAIVLRVLPGAFGVDWGYNTAGYSDGKPYYSTDSGETWEGRTPDFTFQTYAGGVPKDSFVTPNGDTAFAGNSWAAQVFTATSNYTIDAIKLYLRRTRNWSEGTITASIRATEVAPAKATTPAPLDTASDVTLDQATITWEDGGGATSYNVYYGDTSGNLTLVSGGQAGTSFIVTGITDGSPYDYVVTRYWRIDSINAAGTTTGDEWSFTTIRSRPPTVTYFYTTTGQYYQLLVQADGSYGDVPGVGVEGTDYVFLVAGYEPNFINTIRKLVGVANNKVWYEDI